MHGTSGTAASEVARLRLEDIDWHNATVHVRTLKTGPGAVLPLPHDVGQALAGYLRHGRPVTSAQQVFVLLSRRVGAPISVSIVERAVERALRIAGIDAPMRGEPLAALAGHRSAWAWGRLDRDRRRVRSPLGGHDADLREC